jgi:hypothetical protein
VTASPERLVPKVHPATRAAEPDDPYTLHATAAPGDPEVLLRCLVQEYTWMGCDAEQILALFRDPFYPALHGLLHAFGEDGLRARIAALLAKTGTFHFRASVSEAAEPEEDEPPLIQLGMSALGKGKSHAEGL